MLLNFGEATSTELTVRRHKRSSPSAVNKLRCSRTGTSQHGPDPNARAQRVNLLRCRPRQPFRSFRAYASVLKISNTGPFLTTHPTDRMTHFKETSVIRDVTLKEAKPMPEQVKPKP